VLAAITTRWLDANVGTEMIAIEAQATTRIRMHLRNRRARMTNSPLLNDHGATEAVGFSLQ
jgi:hypothetical protein